MPGYSTDAWQCYCCSLLGPSLRKAVQDLDRNVDKVSPRRQRMLWVASLFMVGAAFLLLLACCTVHLALCDRGLLFPSSPVLVQVPDHIFMMAATETQCLFVEACLMP